MFALSRYGGLRCPSEHLALKWGDVNFEKGRILIHSSKTERHEGKAMRVIPMFPELHDPLLEVFNEAEEGTEYVITRYRDLNCNLRTQLNRIIKRAGLSPWPRLFHNLRASRQNELKKEFSIDLVCEWIGNTVEVARDHYLHATDADFAKALGGNAAQQPVAMSVNEKKPFNTPNEKHSEIPVFATQCNSLRDENIAAAGLEPATQGL